MVYAVFHSRFIRKNGPFMVVSKTRNGVTGNDVAA